MARQSKQYADQVSLQLASLSSARKGIRSLPDDILLTALKRYKNGRFSPGQGRLAANEVAEHLRRTMADFEVRTGEARTVGRAGNANAVTIYSAKPVTDGDSTYFGAYFHALVFRETELWFLSSIEPAMTTTHLYQRILERSKVVYPDFSAAQKRLSAFWPLLVEAGVELRRTRGTSRPIFNFAYPWADGLLLGDMQKVSGQSVGRPSFIRFKDGVGEERELQDAYTNGDKRLLVFVRTFVGPDEMKPGQILLADRMNAVVDAFPDVVEHLRLRWQIAYGFEDEISAEIMRAMAVPIVSAMRIRQAVADIVAVIDTKEWEIEAEFNRKNQRRFQTDAERRSGTGTLHPTGS